MRTVTTNTYSTLARPPPMLVLDRFDGDVELYFKKTEHDGNEVHRELSECEPPTGCPYLVGDDSSIGFRLRLFPPPAR